MEAGIVFMVLGSVVVVALVVWLVVQTARRNREP
jgi:hypothetical protein